MNDPWRTDASTSASERLEQVDLDGDLSGSEPRPSYSREVAVPKGTDGQLEQGHMQGASPDQVDAKGKGKIEDATPASSQQTPKEQASPATVNGHTPSAAESAHHQTPTQSEQKIPQGTTTQDALPKSMPTVFPNKQPTQKKIDKSLKKSKAAPRVLDSVISKTRQKDLPPKPKEEDDKHLKQYEHILEESAKAERKRETLAQQRRSTKDKEINAALPIWEKDIVPNWKVVLDDEKLRKIWWSGTMPAKCRGLLWTACIGNGLAIGKSSYTKSLAQANSHIEQQRMPQSILDDIDVDIQDALPQVKFFQPGAPLHDDLRNLLLAYSVFWKREPSYSRGVSYIAALLLVNLPVQDAFVSLVCLIQKSCIRHFFEKDQQDYIDAYDRVFGTLLADHMPKVYHNFTGSNIRPSMYLHPWLRTCFIHFLSLDCATRVFDIFVLEGDSFLFRVALAILTSMEARLFNPDKQELEELFLAKDKGAAAVVRREKKRDDVNVWPDEVYEQCGATENSIFAALDQIQWRESSWDRILQRELPG